MRYTQLDILKVARDQWINDWYFLLPAQIVSYDSLLQRAEVRPLLRRPILLEDQEIEVNELQNISNVPVLFSRGGDYFQSIQLDPGDAVTLLFCDQSTDAYNSSLSIGADIDPSDLRKHDINDCIAFPGWYPFAKAIVADIAKGIVIGKQGGAQVRIEDNLVQVTSNGLPESIGGFVALAEKVDDFIQRFHNVMLVKWVVPGSPDAGAALKLAYTNEFTLPLGSPPQLTGSTNLKAD